jgi:hypothetical protein
MKRDNGRDRLWAEYEHAVKKHNEVGKALMSRCKAYFDCVQTGFNGGFDPFTLEERKAFIQTGKLVARAGRKLDIALNI